jgi:hypothetical protein
MTVEHPLRLAGAAIITALLAAVAALWLAVAPASAGAPTTIDNVSIDLNTTGNTASSVGTVQNCSVMGIGDTLTFDVVVHPLGVPGAAPTTGMSALGFNVLYDQTIVNIVDAPGVTLAHDFLLGATGGTAYLDVGDPRPDSDGSYNQATLDLNANYDSGPGVLVRLGAQAIAAGVSTISIEGPYDGDPWLVLDQDNNVIPADNADSAYILVGQAASGCDDPDGDTIPNFLDDDDDGDGVDDTGDLCASTATGATVDVNGCSDAQVDPDADGVCSPTAPSAGPSNCTGADNCPTTANAGQEDQDDDGAGDACDTDIDGDGFTNTDEEAAGSDALDATSQPESETYNPGSCSDSVDNDGDGDTDAADSGCAAAAATATPTSTASPGPTPTAAELPESGGPGSSSDSTWPLVTFAGLATLAAGASIFAYRRMRRKVQG